MQPAAPSLVSPLPLPGFFGDFLGSGLSFSLARGVSWPLTGGAHWDAHLWIQSIHRLSINDTKHIQVKPSISGPLEFVGLYDVCNRNISQ
jgi:hypothetical protein